MAKEKHQFLVQQRIRELKTDNGKIIDLKQEIELEVNWIQSTGKIENQIIELEKDGKKYKFHLDATIQKGLFKDKVKSLGFGIHEPGKQNFTLENMDSKHPLIALQNRTTGYFWLGGILLFLVVGIGGYFLWKKKQK